MITIRIDDSLWIREAELPSDVQLELFAEFTYPNPEFKQKQYRGLSTANVPKEIETWTKVDDQLSFPRGGASRVLAILYSRGLKFVIDDQRVNGKALPETWSIRKKLYAHQEKVPRLMLDLEQVLIRAPTGSGKTLAALASIVALGRWALVLVPTVQLAKQWIEDAMKNVEGVTADDFGMIGDGQFKIAPITVALPASVGTRMSKLREVFGTFVFDEVQRGAANSFRAVVANSPARYRLGVSADERRKDKKEFLIHDLFGQVVLDIDRADLIAKGVVLEVEVEAVETATEFEQYRTALERARQMTDGRAKKLASFRMMRVQHEMAELFVRDDARNKTGIDLVCDAIGNGHSVLVFVHRRVHAERLRAMLVERGEARVGLMIGGKPDAAEFAATVRGMREGSIRVGIGTYSAMGTGIDLPAVDRGVCMGPIHTNRPFFGQVRGRFCRVGSADAVLWYLWDRRIFDRTPLRALCAWNAVVRVRYLDGTVVPGKAAIMQGES